MNFNLILIYAENLNVKIISGLIKPLIKGLRFINDRQIDIRWRIACFISPELSKDRDTWENLTFEAILSN